jgi:hypothetical protein
MLSGKPSDIQEGIFGAQLDIVLSLEILGISIIVTGEERHGVNIPLKRKSSKISMRLGIYSLEEIVYLMKPRN